MIFWISPRSKLANLIFIQKLIDVAEVVQASLAFVKSQAMKKSIELTYEQERTRLQNSCRSETAKTNSRQLVDQCRQVYA